MALADLHHVTVADCQTSLGDKTIDFYPKNVRRSTVKKHLREDGWRISHKEELENGEFVSFFVKNNH